MLSGYMESIDLRHSIVSKDPKATLTPGFGVLSISLIL